VRPYCFGVAGSRSASGVRLGSEAPVASPCSGGVRTSPLAVVSVVEVELDDCVDDDELEDDGDVMSLDEPALPGYAALEDVELPGVVTSLDELALPGAVALEEAELPGDVTSLEDEALPVELVSLAVDEASAVRVRPGCDSDCHASNSACETEPSPSASAVANDGSSPLCAAASLADTMPSPSLSSAVNESVVVSASAANARTLATAPVRDAAAYFIVGLLSGREKSSRETTGTRRADQCAALATGAGPYGPGAG
jgi:hypothetical protein